MTARTFVWNGGAMGPVPSFAWSGTDREEPASPVDWEREAIEAVQRGCPDAFNPLVTYYAPRIRAYLHRMVGNREEADDLTQETFIRAYRALDRFQAHRPFKRWLYTIATNAGLNALRARKNRGTAVALDPEQMEAHEPRPMAPADRAEALEAAMLELPPRAARLVELHYREGFTLAEAGAMLDMSESAAKVALCRARKTLRTAMQNWRSQ